jgi:hypothetical protein
MISVTREGKMQATLEVSTGNALMVSQSEAQRTANEYVVAHIDPAFEVVSGEHYFNKRIGRAVWQFIIRCQQGPLDSIQVDGQTGEVIPLTEDQVRIMWERAVIAESRDRGELPVDEHGFVLSEYARRKANGYLSMDVSLFCSASDGVLIPMARPIWQFAIRFRLPRMGELGILGTLDVDAQTGEPIVLTSKQIKHMRARADAIVEFRTQTAAA